MPENDQARAKDGGKQSPKRRVLAVIHQEIENGESRRPKYRSQRNETPDGHNDQEYHHGPENGKRGQVKEYTHSSSSAFPAFEL